MILFKVITRLLAFVSKELIETIRRPGALLSLVLGPFLILAMFGIGFSGIRRPLDTVVVVPTQSGLPQDPAEYQKFGGAGVNIVAVTPDEAGARQLLAAQKVDLVIIAPSNIVENFKAGKQSTLDVEYNVTDPVEANYAGILAERLSNEVNQEIIRQAAQQGEQQAATFGVQGTPIPPDVVAQPTVTELHNLSPTGPGVILFFGPAVVALILQHMAVTLTSLSLVRERMSGVMELFRVAPVSALEIVLGKYVAFGILNALIAAVVMALLVAVFHVPVLGSIVAIVAVLALLGFASLGLGLFISVISDSERQAVQLSLLVLLASVFFSGFVINIDQFIPAVRTFAYAIPVTHGIRLLQDFLLRGSTIATWELGVLGGMGVVLFVLTWLGLRRSLRPA